MTRLPAGEPQYATGSSLPASQGDASRRPALDRLDERLSKSLLGLPPGFAGGIWGRMCAPSRGEKPVKMFAIFFALASVLVLGTLAQSPASPPSWAFPVNPPDFKESADHGGLRHVPNSNAGFTLTQARDFFFAPDWHPDDHPPMPEIVAHGRKPDVPACGFCHRADGPGGPENSSLAGLPEAYIVQQVADFKSGARKTSVPARLPFALMASLAKAATDAEVASAATYFSSLKPRKIITVIETNEVPKTYVAEWILAAVNDRDKEPIGNRIIEVPKDLGRFDSRDSRAEFIACVPVGSVAKGEVLAKTGGNGKTTQCSICHGPNLKGLGPIPGIAGRSPSYIVRQLYDIQHGARTGPASPLMTGVVTKLNEDDFVSLAAYAASLAP
jgi:cytochrome c553